MTSEDKWIMYMPSHEELEAWREEILSEEPDYFDIMKGDDLKKKSELSRKFSVDNLVKKTGALK